MITIKVQEHSKSVVIVSSSNEDRPEDLHIDLPHGWSRLDTRIDPKFIQIMNELLSCFGETIIAKEKIRTIKYLRTRGCASLLEAKNAYEAVINAIVPECKVCYRRHRVEATCVQF